MSTKRRLFAYLYLAGFSGILSILLLDLNALISMLPTSASAEIPLAMPLLKVVSLIQPAIILAVAVLVGVALAPKVGLSAPAFEALAGGDRVVPRIAPQVIPGLIGGVVGGIAIVISASIVMPFLPSGAAARISEFTGLVPLALRVLYGGITEELLLRWGFMTLLVWAMWRLLRKGQGLPKPQHFIVAIIISSLTFGVAHLPIAYLLFPEPTIALIVFVVIANSVFGLVAGYLFWRRGLESAMIAHVVAHLVMFGASRLGAYF